MHLIIGANLQPLGFRGVSGWAAASTRRERLGPSVCSGFWYVVITAPSWRRLFSRCGADSPVFLLRPHWPTIDLREGGGCMPMRCPDRTGVLCFCGRTLWNKTRPPPPTQVTNPNTPANRNGVGADTTATVATCTVSVASG